MEHTEGFQSKGLEHAVHKALAVPVVDSRSEELTKEKRF